MEAQVFLAYRKDLGNLALQESRLRRRHEADLAELKNIQRERRETAAARMEDAIKLTINAENAS